MRVLSSAGARAVQEPAEAPVGDPVPRAVLGTGGVRKAADLSVTTSADVRVAQLAAVQAAEAERLAEQRRRELADAHAAGYAAAGAEGAAAALRGANALAAAVEVARTAHHAHTEDVTRAVLSAALDVAEWVLRAELSADSRRLLVRLEEAVGGLLPGHTTRLLVSPADAETVRGWAGTVPQALEVVADPALPAGDAVLRTDGGEAEVTVAAALRVAAEVLGVDPGQAAL